MKNDKNVAKKQNNGVFRMYKGPNLMMTEVKSSIIFRHQLPHSAVKGPLFISHSQ